MTNEILNENGDLNGVDDPVLCEEYIQEQLDECGPTTPDEIESFDRAIDFIYKIS